MNFIRTQLKTRQRRLACAALGATCFFGVLTWSGIEAFQRHTEPVPLAATQTLGERPSLGDRPAPNFDLPITVTPYEEVGGEQSVQHSIQPIAIPVEPQPTLAPAAITLPDSIKRDRLGNPILVNGKPWTGEVFDHKPIRPVSKRTMKTTAYSPDARSCGKWADGITASGKSVWMNGGRLVAADRSVPYGTILTIPGYNNEQPVQVWDRGGAIKGNRLDLLYPTHEIALQWGVQDLPVVFWEFVETD